MIVVQKFCRLVQWEVVDQSLQTSVASLKKKKMQLTIKFGSAF